MTHPLIPYLDDRVAIVGRSGYGKSNAAKGAVEQLLKDDGVRVCVVDPTDSWYGLRLQRDGKTPAYPVVIFGGDHGDLPLTEASGETIGLAVAQSSQSCIVSLASFIGENARRRFAAAFLSALYEHNRAPLHLIVDEADTLAPQRTVSPLDNEVLARMQQIVRRGRIRGFTPWLLTQRPAVISKDVLSQADVLVAFNLTSSQDRDALGAWIEGQADKAGERAIRNELPKLARGRAVVWAPGHDSLETLDFPLSATFDSGRTPKRGEQRQVAQLQAIDVGALKERIATVEAEVKATDPKALKVEIARLEKLLEDGGRSRGATPEQLEAARNEGYANGYRIGGEQALSKIKPRMLKFVEQAVGWALAPEEDDAQTKLPAVYQAPRASSAAKPPSPSPRSPSGEVHPAAVKMTAALVRQGEAVTWAELCTLAGMVPGNGYFYAGRKDMTARGYFVDVGGDRITLSGAARDAVGKTEAPLKRSEIVAIWTAKHDGAAPSMLQYLGKHANRTVSTDELAQAIGMKPGNGYWYRGVKLLRDAGLIEQSGGAFGLTDLLKRAAS